jgi:hypothetical protein
MKKIATMICLMFIMCSCVFARVKYLTVAETKIEANNDYTSVMLASYDAANSNSDILNDQTATEDNLTNTPASYGLEQNYPNPFNPSTSIKFALPSEARVTLKVYNLLGQQVALIVNNSFQAGNHNVKFDASKMKSGIYMYTIQARGIDGSQFTCTKKMMLLK